MSRRRFLVALSMTSREFLRRRGMLAAMFGIPVFGYLLIFLALPDAAASVDAIENGVRVQVDIGQRDLFGGFQALTYVGLMAGLVGLNLLHSALRADRRLIVAGYRAADLVAARIGLLTLLDVAVTLFLVGLTLFFFTPRQLAAFTLACFWTALIYSFYGALIGVFIRNEMGGIMAVLFLVNIDVGYLEIPGFSNVIDEWYAVLLPGYFPAQLAIDAAYTATLERLGQSLWTLAHGAVIAGTVLAGYQRATHLHRFSAPKPAARFWQAAAALLAVLALGGGGWYGYRVYQVQPPVVEADGRVHAPEGRVVALLTGSIRSLAVAEGDEVTHDQILAWIEDPAGTQRLPARSPLAGRVTTLPVRVYENVILGEVLALVHDMSRPEVVLEVEETAVGKLAVGQQVQLRFGALGETFVGRVAEIAQEPLPPEPGVSERTRRVRKYAVKTALPQPDPRLRLGMAAHGTVSVGP